MCHEQIFMGHLRKILDILFLQFLQFQNTLLFGLCFISFLCLSMNSRTFFHFYFDVFNTHIFLYQKCTKKGSSVTISLKCSIFKKIQSIFNFKKILKYVNLILNAMFSKKDLTLHGIFAQKEFISINFKCIFCKKEFQNLCHLK